MTWPAVALAALNVAQVIALAWIAAWQRRAAHVAKEIETHVVEAIANGTNATEHTFESSGPSPMVGPHRHDAGPRTPST